jgi:hypothetical protein
MIHGQTPQVNNSGFENWETSTSELAEPLDWNSFKTASGTYKGFGGQQMDRSTDVRPGSSGIYSAYIFTKTILSIPANGNMTTGQINMGSLTPSNSNNYNVAHTANSAFSETLGGHPDSLVVWVKTIIANASNQPRIRAVIHDTYDYRDPSGSDANSPNHVVADATLNFTSINSVWLRKSIPFNYTGPATSPNYILVTFTTCKDPGVGTANDAVYVDDLLLVYNPTLTTGTISPLTYNVTPSLGTSVSVPFTLTGTMNPNNNKPNNVVTAQLSDANGSFANPVILGTLTTATSGTITGTIPAGTTTGSGYRIRVVSSNYPLVAANNGTNIQINNVSTKTLNLKVFVEGLYVGGDFMREATDFNPVTEEFLPKWGAGIADVVTVKLYNNTYSTLVASYPGVYLHTNGNLIVTGINGSLNGSYYITIFHRNSVPITSATPISFAGSPISYDFTYPVDKAYGAGSDPQKNLGDGYFGMYTGEQDHDAYYVIDGSDVSILDPDIISGPYGYLNTDLNGDGVVDGSDMSIMDGNAIFGPLFWNPSVAK